MTGFRRRAFHHIPYIFIVAAFVATALRFAGVQTIWLDETTQLSGITLPPLAVIDWLAGNDALRFGVPGDRMPPLSYILGWAWSTAAGASPVSMRLLGVALVTSATVPVWAAAKRVGGYWGACVATLFFCLSPNVIAVAVEIRAYPLFLTLASFGFWVLLRAVLERSRGAVLDTWLLCLLAVMASYTHFFGLFFGGAVLSTLLFMLFVQQRPLHHAVAASAVFLVSSIGLWPFINSATQMTGGAPVPDTSYAWQLTRLVYRIVAHPASSMMVELQVPYLFGLAAIAGAGVYGLARVRRHRSGVPSLFASIRSTDDRIAGFVAVTVALSAGMAATILATFFLSRGLVFTPSYSVWMIPGMSIVLAACVGMFNLNAMRHARFAKALFLAGAGCFALGAAGTLIVFVQKMPFFTHGSSTAIVRAIKAQPLGTPVYHDKSGIWAHIYFPLWYEFGPALGQFVLEDERDAVVARKIERAATRFGTAEKVLPKRVILVSAASWGTANIRHAIRDGATDVPAGPVAARLLTDPAWRVVEDISLVSFIAARVQVIER
jgi:4-amino-4-deoxy-L-arabinose transferase-like glycosyltransferase